METSSLDSRQSGTQNLPKLQKLRICRFDGDPRRERRERRARGGSARCAPGPRHAHRDSFGASRLSPVGLAPHAHVHALRASATTASCAHRRRWSTSSNGFHRETARDSPAVLAALSHAVSVTVRRSVRAETIDAVWHCRARRSTNRACHRAAAKSGDTWRGHAAQTIEADYHWRPDMVRCIDGRRQGGLSRNRADGQIPQFPQFPQFPQIRTDFFLDLGGAPKVPECHKFESSSRLCELNCI